MPMHNAEVLSYENAQHALRDVRESLTNNNVAFLLEHGSLGCFWYSLYQQLETHQAELTDAEETLYILLQKNFLALARLYINELERQQDFERSMRIESFHMLMQFQYDRDSTFWPALLLLLDDVRRQELLRYIPTDERRCAHLVERIARIMPTVGEDRSDMESIFAEILARLSLKVLKYKKKRWQKTSEETLYVLFHANIAEIHRFLVAHDYGVVIREVRVHAQRITGQELR